MKKLVIILIVGVFAFSACKKTPVPQPTGDKAIEELNIPDSFNFNTTSKISVTISDFEENTEYAIYSMTDINEPEIVYTAEDTLLVIDNSNQLLATGNVNGTWTVDLTVPKHQEYLYIKRLKDGGAYGENVKINGSSMNFAYSAEKSTKAQTVDILWAANGQGQAFSIDIETGISTLLTTFPKGANANAVDKANNVMYVAEKSSPYRLRSINLTTGDQIVIANLNKNFDRMAYDADNGLIYLGRGKKLYTYDPFATQYINEFTLVGEYNNNGGGDISIGPDGDLFFTSVSAKILYKGVISGNQVLLQTISTALPEKSTSATIGSDGFLYYGTNHNPSKIYRTNIENGNTEFLYQISNFKINDLGMLKKDSNNGGGNGGNGNIWTPGENIWGTLAFEDLWPAKGDYDFNDLVLRYRIHQITNSDNDVTSIEGKFTVRHIGAYFVNGFAIELPIAANKIASVSGNNITDNAVTLSGNGTESGQQNAVIVLFDNANDNLGVEMDLVITFTEPISQSQLGDAPYNPFIIKNQERDYEVHLPNMKITDLADESHLGTLDDNSIPADNRYFKTDKNLPWGINIPVDFVWPKEKVEIVEGYLKFAEWAETGGSSFPDWYKDLSGYRSESHLDIQN